MSELTIEKRKMRRRVVGWTTAVVLGSGALAGCGGDSQESSSSDYKPTPTTKSEKIFPNLKFIHNWNGKLPDRVILNPRHETERSCLEGDYPYDLQHPRPLVSEQPPIVRADARCNAPVESEEVGLYSQPEQKGTPTKVLNGEALGVECTTTGQEIQDIRGTRTATKSWLGVITQQGEPGYVPVTNVAFSQPRELPHC